MDPRQLTNGECGQSNPLVQMASHLTQDHAYQDRIGSTECPTNSFMPPQTFRMNDLMKEMNIIESSEEPSAQYQNQLSHPYLHQTEEEQIKDSLQSSTSYEIPQATHLYRQIPQPMHLPHQSHRLGLPLAPQPEGMTDKIQKEINESKIAEISAEYKVIESLDELVDCEENNKSQNIVQEPKLTQQSKIEKINGNVDTDGEKLTKKDHKPDHFELTVLDLGKVFLAEKKRTDAILHFERAIELDENCVEAWKLLGITRLDQVQNTKAIYALKRGLSLDPQDLDMMMALALCYSTNSFYPYCKHKSLSMLYSWLKHHPEYNDIIPENYELKDNIKETDTSLKEIQDMFIKAARLHPINYDYEVQSALGILFSLSNEYDKAVDCYRSALQVKSHDARLWNRLGVILGKQQKEQEELNTYKQALVVDPSLTCCHNNIALTYSNLKLYRLAAKHFLTALNLQARAQYNFIFIDHTSDDVWSQLYKCLSHMGHDFDLLSAVISKDLKKLTQEFSTER